MNVLSLFDGMSCGQIALEKLGIKVDNYFASEIKKHAIKVTQDNYPKTKQIGSVEFVNKYFPKTKVVISKENLGFAGGNNLGVKKAKGEYLLLINNDTWVEKTFLEKWPQ